MKNERRAFCRLTSVHYVQAGLLFGAFLFATITAYLLANISQNLSCPLSARWTFRVNVNGTAYLVGDSRRTGADASCNLVQFGSVAAAFAAFILGFILLLLKPYVDAYNNR
jgi:hypothetical protein